MAETQRVLNPEKGAQGRAHRSDLASRGRGGGEGSQPSRGAEGKPEEEPPDTGGARWAARQR